MPRTCMQSICAIKSNVGQSIQGDSRVVRSSRRTAEVFLLVAFPAVLHCSLDSCKVICDVVDLLCLISPSPSPSVFCFSISSKLLGNMICMHQPNLCQCMNMLRSFILMPETRLIVAPFHISSKLEVGELRIWSVVCEKFILL